MDDNTVITTAKGEEILVSAVDYDRVVAVGPWYVGDHGYAVHKSRRRGSHLMHRFILDAPKGLQVDHVNGAKLDNRRSNLRLCTLQGNNRNRAANAVSAVSSYKGVFLAYDGKYTARIGTGTDCAHLGVYDSPEEAARAYDSAAMYYHGEFARTNFPDAMPLTVGEIRSRIWRKRRPRSGYRGVTKAMHGHNQPWTARIDHKGVKYHLGYFSDPEAAARAYDDAARKLLGDRAVTNFPS